MRIFGGNSKRNARKSLSAMTALILILCVAVGGAVAFIVTGTVPVENKFTPADVTVKIVEEFKNNIKSSITVLNVDDKDKEDVPCYIRVKLVSNIQDSNDNVLGAAPLGEISLNSDWIDGGDGCYYYKNVVAVGASTTNLLADGAEITLINGQVVEVLAEGIQSVPDNAVEEAWPTVKVVDGVLQVKGA